MKIIISPAKKMNVDTDSLAIETMPVMLQKTEELKQWIQTLSWEQTKKLWNCNDKLVDLNVERFREMDLHRNLTPAVLSYEGLQYQYMAPGVMEDVQHSYIQEHLRILSGFYGILAPFDGVVPYRLEMQAKANVNGQKDLYSFWGDTIYQALTESDHMILNLASKEYSKAIEPYLQKEDRFVTCVFGEYKDGKVVQKGTMAKMARGEMVNFLSAIKASQPEDAKGFDRMEYRYQDELSTETEYVFFRGPIPIDW